jgi:type II secretory pathway pseudopilin PulG
MSKEPAKSNTSVIVIAIIGALSTICAASIGAVTTYNVEKMRQESELTRIALVSIVTQGGATQESMASTISAPADTPYPTQTLQPTFTPYPTYTSAPLPTIPPTASIVFPFTDTFDSQLDPAWKVVNGTPLIMNGALRSTNGNLSLELPGNFSPNYVISFDFNGKDYYMWGNHEQNRIEVIFSSRVSCRIDDTGADWRAFDGNNWVTVSKAAGNDQVNTYPNESKFKFVVQENFYQLYYNNLLVSEIRYGENLPPGPIGLYVGEFMQIDNFTVTLP